MTVHCIGGRALLASRTLAATATATAGGRRRITSVHCKVHRCPSKPALDCRPWSRMSSKRVPAARYSAPKPQGPTGGGQRNSAASVTADADTEQETEGIPRGNMWRIHKFGGTCLSFGDRIVNAVEIITADDSEKLACIVSAMGTPGPGFPKITDMLYSLVQKAEARDATYLTDLDEIMKRHIDTAAGLLRDDPEALSAFKSTVSNDVANLKAMLRAIYIAHSSTDPFSDFVVGHGEIWSAQLITAVTNLKLKRSGSKRQATFLDARDVLVVNPTEDGTSVDVDFDTSLKRLRNIWNDKAGDILIVTGFIASTPDRTPTTLKRDGSDFSATIFAALLEAKIVTIWTDVDGVFSADPRKVPEAVVLKELSYEEAWELSYFGASVLHPRTTLPVMARNIPIEIRNFFDRSKVGTLVKEKQQFQDDELPEGKKYEFVKGFATVDDISLLNVEGTGLAGVPGTASSIFGAVRDAGINVIMISQASSEHSVCFAVPKCQGQLARVALEERFSKAIAKGRIRKVEVIEDCAILAAVGSRMDHVPGVSATMFAALAKANINIRAIAQGCSENNITVVIDGKDAVKGLSAVHARFYLSETPLAVGIVGPGLIGKTFLSQIREQQSILHNEFNIDLRVLAIAGTQRMLLSPTGINLDNWEEEYKANSEPSDLQKFSNHLALSFMANAVVVDNTASEIVANQYEKWLSSGLHVITPNKKANSGNLEYYKKLRDIQRNSYTHYFYEATVGAGLPILSTLKHLVETGDKIKTIEGIFSGTLSYIFNNFDETTKFSDIVSEAKEKGYTEPDPRDDLTGLDVARKVTILARESGLLIELDDVPIRSLVPEEIADIESVSEFMSELPKYDDALTSAAKEASEAGEVLRYVGVVDVENKRGSVELKRYPMSHAFAQLSGSDNIISFRTTRYDTQPLIVRGPGAGPEVTAGGVFADLLRLAAYLGAPS